MNYMAKVAEMLGVELGERFMIEGNACNTYRFEEKGLICEGLTSTQVYHLEYLLTGAKAIVKLPWKPKYGKKYYSVATDGKITMNHWHGIYYDIALYAFGNCFRTGAEAEAHKDEILQKMKEVLEG